LKNDFDQAIEEYSVAIRLDDMNFSPYANRGATYGILGKYDLAIEDLSKAIQLGQKCVCASLYYDRGKAYALQGRYGLAIDGFTTAIQSGHKDCDVYRARGFAYFRMGNHGKAVADLDEAIKIDPKNGGAYYCRWLAQSKKEMSAQAKADFVKARELGFATGDGNKPEDQKIIMWDFPSQPVAGRAQPKTR